jgi:hypothetical protein
LFDKVCWATILLKDASIANKSSNTFKLVIYRVERLNIREIIKNIKPTEIKKTASW